MVLTGSPCQNFPRPRPEEGPEPYRGITWRQLGDSDCQLLGQLLGRDRVQVLERLCEPIGLWRSEVCVGRQFRGCPL
jgi:hypothetical protein